MTKAKTIEFWLFALPILIVIAAVLAGFDGIRFVRDFIPGLAVAWMLLAIAFMFRAFLRWVRG